MRWLLVVAAIGGNAAAGPCEYPLPPPLPPAAPAASCHRPPAAVARAVTDAIAKDFEPVIHGGKLRVDYGCDGLGEHVREIVVETGSGHGGSLSLWRARRSAAGRYDVLGIAYRDSSTIRPAKHPPYELVTGTVELTEADVARIRAAVTAAIGEDDPPPRPDSFPGMTSSFSSADFHISIRLVDDDGRAVERRFTGYGGNMDQQRYLGLRAAQPALAPITSLASAPGAPTADTRELFAERFVASVPAFDDDFYWWVKERYVDLAWHFGTPAVIPGLLSRLHVTKPKDRSQVDTRDHALAALAAITGWDARRETRSADDAAARYLAACHAITK
ncbi:MAG TPA: hypothetical protein VMJ10_37860 [Kofleriaceae bacterium]|nr:hypothetical protein [Kofleriaceae bacterium]